MTCKLCAPFIGKGMRRLGSVFSADEPRCAFDAEGKFKDLNWDCQTLSRLRRHPYATENYSEDQTLLTIPKDGRFVVLGHYKRRGRVEVAILVDEYTAEPLTLAVAEDFADYPEKHCPIRHHAPDCDCNGMGGDR